MSEYGVNTNRLVLVSIVSVIITAAVIIVLQAVYFGYQAAVERKVADREPAKLEALLSAQRPRLTDYGVLDAEKGIVTIPVSRAMELVVAESSEPKESEDVESDPPPREESDE